MKLAKSLPAAVATLGVLVLMLVLATGAIAGSSEDMQFLRQFGEQPGFGSPYGPGLLGFPTDVAVEQSTGDFWVSNSSIGRVQKYEPRYGPNGEFVEYHLLLELGSAGEFNEPLGLAVDHAGDLYVVDYNNHRVQKFGPDGKFILMFGGGVLTGGAKGTGTLTESSTTVSSVVTTSKAFLVGQTITGPGIPAGTTITALEATSSAGASSLILSQPVASGAGVVAGAPLTVAEGAGNVPTNEQQTVTIGGAPTGGAFTLTFTTPSPSPTTSTTGPIAYNASATEVKSALESLTNMSAVGGEVAVSGASGGPYTVEFKGTRYADTNVTAMTSDAAGLTPSGTVTVATTREGHSAPEICAVAAECQAGAAGSGNGAFSSWPFGYSFIAVGGPKELVYVGDRERVQTFEPTGAWRADISLASLGAGTVQSLAIDPAGDLYVYDTAAAGVRELNPTGTSQIREFDAGSTTVSAIALAPSGDVVVIDRRPTAANTSPNFHGIVYSPLGVELNESFGETELVANISPPSPFGMAYDDARNELYVAVRVPQHMEVFKGPSIFATATTGPPMAPEAESVTLTGEVNPEGLDASAFFEYGPCATPTTCAASAYGSSAPAVQAAGGPTPGSADLGSGTANVPVEAHVTSGVQPNRTYHYRLVGHDEKGDSPARNEEAFTTPRIAPAVEIQPVSFLTFQGVSLNGAVNPENSPTSYRFLYGPCRTRTTCGASGYPSSSPVLTATPQYGHVTSEQEVQELQPATTYHYRLVATNDHGETAESFEGRFTTLAAPVPGVVSGPASGVTQTTATLSGSVAPNGLAVTYGFQLGTEAGGYGPEIGLASAAASVAGVPVALPVQNLQPGTTYHYRLMAANGYETIYGADETFTTPGYPSPLAAPMAPPLLAVPSIVFPKEPAAVALKKLTRAQRLGRALGACKKKPKSKRSRCERTARKKYAAKPKKHTAKPKKKK